MARLLSRKETSRIYRERKKEEEQFMKDENNRLREERNKARRGRKLLRDENKWFAACNAALKAQKEHSDNACQQANAALQQLNTLYDKIRYEKKKTRFQNDVLIAMIQHQLTFDVPGDFELRRHFGRYMQQFCPPVVNYGQYATHQSMQQRVIMSAGHFFHGGQPAMNHKSAGGLAGHTNNLPHGMTITPDSLEVQQAVHNLQQDPYTVEEYENGEEDVVSE